MKQDADGDTSPGQNGDNTVRDGPTSGQKGWENGRNRNGLHQSSPATLTSPLELHTTE